MRRQLLSLAAVILTAGFIAAPSASAQQSVNFFVGGFVPVAADARGDITNGRSNDILVRDRDFLTFGIDRFKGVTFGGEYLAPLGDFFEAGASLGYYQQTVAAADTKFVAPNGSNVIADLKLRIVPFNATFRFLPLGRHHYGVEPYIGAGIGVFGWRYSESGQFVDYTPPVPRNPPIFNGTFAASGVATGPVVLGGVRFPMGAAVPGFEIKWQKARTDFLPTGPGADFPKDAAGNPTTLVDLGGMNYLFTFAIRF